MVCRRTTLPGDARVYAPDAQYGDDGIGGGKNHGGIRGGKRGNHRIIGNAAADHIAFQTDPALEIGGGFANRLDQA